jgi:hypothetical protein
MAAWRARPVLVTHRLGISFRSMIMFRRGCIMLVATRSAHRVLIAHALVTCLGFALIPRGCAGTGDEVCRN